MRRCWSSTVVACLREFGKNFYCGANGVKKKKKCKPNRNPENPKNLKLNPKNPKLTKQISYLKNCEIVREFQTPKILHTNLLYTPPPSSENTLPYPQSRYTEVRCPQEEVGVYYAF